MPTIIDVHIAPLALFKGDPQFRPISDGIEDGTIRVVYGGRLTREYNKIQEVMRRIATLDRAGRALLVDGVDAQEEVLTNSNACVSDDQHIIALAQLSGARLLCSFDQLLHSDFTNKKLLDKPRGKVYQDTSHAKLIGVLGR